MLCYCRISAKVTTLLPGNVPFRASRSTSNRLSGEEFVIAQGSPHNFKPLNFGKYYCKKLLSGKLITSPSPSSKKSIAAWCIAIAIVIVIIVIALLLAYQYVRDNATSISPERQTNQFFSHAHQLNQTNSILQVSSTLRCSAMLQLSMVF